MHAWKGSYHIEIILKEKMLNKIWKLEKGKGPLVATANHNGHEIRSELKEFLFISNAERLREEDPFTGEWTQMANIRVIGMRSRFEVDLNRPREKAVYLNPEDAWNLKVWNTKLPDKEVENSLSEYDAFYAEMYRLFSEIENHYGHFVVFDLHSYNHQRNGPGTLPADPELNPEVNIGTGTMDRNYWSPVVDRFIKALSDFDYSGRHLDVRENIRFRGGNFPRWIHQNFSKTGCALAIEFKKFFMNEWTGEPDPNQLKLILMALKSTIPEVLDALRGFKK